jgi:hypothetical protein
MTALSPRSRSLIPWAAGLGALGAAALVLRRVSPRIEYRLHVVGPDGYVAADPAGLTRNVGATLPSYALASMMESEESTDKGRLAVGLAAWNAARHDPDRLLRLLAPRGRFGSQEVNPYASTSKGPSSRTLALAAAVLDGRATDFVEGATLWDAPRTQDKLHSLYLADPSRHPKYKHGSADVARRRVAAGYRMVMVPGVPNTRFWTRVA